MDSLIKSFETFETFLVGAKDAKIFMNKLAQSYG